MKKYYLVLDCYSIVTATKKQIESLPYDKYISVHHNREDAENFVNYNIEEV